MQINIQKYNKYKKIHICEVMIKMRICSKCVLPETTPKISFDENGVCNFCHSFKKPNYKGEKELIKILDAQKNKKNKYDCVVTLSGGRDSSYTILKLVKDYHMNVLAVNFENPFTDDQAVRNIENIKRILNVDLISFKMKDNTFEKVFKNNVEAWFKKPSPSMVPMMCAACHMMFIDFLRIAKENNISCIISGGNPYEYVSFKRELLGVSHNEDPNMVYIKYFFGLLRESSKNPGYFSPVCLPTMIKGYLFGNEGAIGTRILGYQMEKFQLFDYLEWNENEILSRISSELEWKYPEKLMSSWRFDCKVSHVKDLMYMKTLQMTERDDLYAKLVRNGLMTRDEALGRIKKENVIYYDEIKEVFLKAGIPEETIETYLKA